MARATTETLIIALMTCGDDESVCEACGGTRKIEEMKTTWVGRGELEEGIDHCPNCTVTNQGEIR